ncbi:helix-turn-helix domain-containing protein [Chelatococcus sp. SYSU_G07232]|uniref:Helix-turn-helix domain-containing protein n=1 Tax=Chelatococcus albus TaxID=3047466 RepID=A0ABT7AK83_9HYPH|nr:TetR/AcrR family transcriptional regulator [Chelatococcus sp. SYSU_G07232]MDJ1159779.1 helix-turn-helix domain-containing protein [Chelatococcus sp. SYSU_G07232]
MSPRPYRLGKRKPAIDETRARILAAGAALLLSREGASRFSIDAVAKRAGVARMTVYYQFGSKLGLVEALFDDVAARGKLADLAAVFADPDPRGALDSFIAVFVRFWMTDRALLRRLSALAGLDPALAAALNERIGWRRQGLRVLVQRLAPTATAERRDAMIDTLAMLTGFETLDALAEGRTTAQAARIIQHLARAAVEKPAAP